MSYEEAQTALHNAISAVADGEFVTHYVVVAATITEDGETAVHSICTPGMPNWQRHGLLSYEASATESQPNWTIHYMYDDEEEE